MSLSINESVRDNLLSASICVIGNEFLLPYWNPHLRLVSSPKQADFVLALNSLPPHQLKHLLVAKANRKPIAWWTIEDPNSFDLFLPQARLADVVFTSDESCIPNYVRLLGHERVYWLPLAACNLSHIPRELVEGATDLVLSANWYNNQARLWAVETLIRPLLRSGHSMSLFCYENFMWPAPFARYRLHSADCRTVSSQYRYGRVVLGLNNQRSGLDGRRHTVMTSMRTFEALACGKPFLSAYSDAYERLGFVNGVHMCWVSSPAEALDALHTLLSDRGAEIAREGREYVLKEHTYRHRLQRIIDVMSSL